VHQKGDLLGPPPRSPPPRIHCCPGGLHCRSETGTTRVMTSVLTGAHLHVYVSGSCGTPKSKAGGHVLRNINTPMSKVRPIPRLYCPGRLRPELFPGIGVLPGPATESHIVNRGSPVAPLGQPQLNVPERKSHPRGKPLQPRFPKEPHHRRAADDSLTAKSRKHTEGIHRRGDGGRDLLRVRWWCARRIVRNFAYDCDIVRCLARGCDGSELVSTGLDVTCFRLVGVVQRLRDK